MTAVAGSPALDAVAGSIGADRVGGLGPDGAAGRFNVGEFGTRQVRGVIRPRTADEVRRVVEIFGRPGTRGRLCPYSTGHNWGLGSREPVDDGDVLLDLGALDAVREIDVEHGWAAIEPGVTQGRLAALLDGTSRMLNVTASSAHTSVIGNMLERGVGLRRHRVADLAGLEVALPDGELLRAGWWPGAGPATPVYPYGLGPSLVQLFVQSGLGVVTGATVRLLPRPEALRVLRFSFDRAALIEAVEVLRRWVAQGLISGVLKVYDTTSARLYGGAEEPGLMAHVCVDGTPAAVDALTGVLVGEAAATGLFRLETGAAQAGAEREPDDVVATLVEHGYRGDPSYNDVLLRATLGQAAAEVDEHGLGWLFFLPLVPFTGAAVSRAQDLLAQVVAETGVAGGATINALDADVIDFVVSLKFDRETQAVAAHRALDRLYELFAAAGFRPYRLDVDHAGWLDRLDPDPSARAFVRRLKTLLDPHTAIAPGRYT